MRRRLLISGNTPPIESYLTFKALEDGLSVQLSKNDCEYCVDYSGDWKHLPSGNSTEEIKQGQTLSFRANITAVDYDGIGTFSATKKFELLGRCETIIYGKPMVISLGNYAFKELFKGSPVVSVSESFLSSPALGQRCYYEMFKDCTSLTSAPALPATTLGYGCYGYMFSGCTSLTEAPALHATSLETYCCEAMFADCTSLTSAPALPANNLVERCYSKMFSGCTSLVSVPTLHATYLNDYCYYKMFSGCTSLTEAPALPATTLAKRCYDSMFSGCTSLTTAPTLPATTLVGSCYQSMFEGCTKLQYVKALFTTEPSINYTYCFLNAVSPTGTFVKSKDATWDTVGVNGVPSGWTIEYE